MARPRRKQIRNDARRFAVVMRQLIAVVETGVEIALCFESQCLYLWRKSREPLRYLANALKRCDSRRFHASPGLSDQIIDQRIEHALQCFVEDQLGGRVRILRSHRYIKALEEVDVPANVIEIENLSFHSVIEVGSEEIG